MRQCEPLSIVQVKFNIAFLDLKGVTSPPRVRPCGVQLREYPMPCTLGNQEIIDVDAEWKESTVHSDIPLCPH